MADSLEVVFKELIDANGFIDDPRRLDELFDEEGYLFFRGVLDREAVLMTMTEMTSVLARQGLVAEGATTPIWSGVKIEHYGPQDMLRNKTRGELYQTRLWERFVADPRINSVFEQILGEPPFFLPIGLYRFPTPDTDSTASQLGFKHQDGFYNDGILFRIAWIPLMDIDLQTGGVAVAPRLHKGGFLHDTESPPRFHIPPGKIPDDVWHRADYKAGDILIMHRNTPHAGIVNRSDRVRLSFDVRFLRASEPRPVFGRISEINADSFAVEDDTQRVQHFQVDATTFVRTANGNDQNFGSKISLESVLSKGQSVMVTSENGIARVVRPPSYQG